jgi:hypothetical protein
MFCPQCGQRQAANEARFCPSCGLPLAVVSEVLAHRGQLPFVAPPPGAPAPGLRQLSPRQKGIRQGAMFMLSTMLFVPLVAFISVFITGAPQFFVPAAAVIFFVGGLLRIIYAAMFEESAPAVAPPVAHAYVPPAAPPPYLGAHERGAALPPPQAAPAPAARPPRFDTGELGPPRASVTDHTTRLLQRQTEEPPQQ